MNIGGRRFAIAIGLVFAAGCASGVAESGNVDTAQGEQVTEVSAASVSAADSEKAEGAEKSAETIAQQADAATLQYFTDATGLAIRGADPVAYFTEGAAVLGSSEFSYAWGNATWQFASAENRDLFAANPEQYAPQYGGFCAWAVSEGYTASIDPEAWRIVDGRLYLNYDSRIQRRWERNIPENIAKADANWPSVLDES